jgi:hypothetical protein
MLEATKRTLLSSRFATVLARRPRLAATLAALVALVALQGGAVAGGEQAVGTLDNDYGYVGP